MHDEDDGEALMDEETPVRPPGYIESSDSESSSESSDSDDDDDGKKTTSEPGAPSPPLLPSYCLS